jgi:hypothetical protein
MTAFSLLPVSLLIAAGCQPAVCPCPLGGAQLTLNPDVQSTIVSVKGDSCSSVSGGNGMDVFLLASKTGTCHLTLADGEVLATDVVFSSLGGCCSNTFAGSASPLVVVDGGPSATIRGARGAPGPTTDRARTHQERTDLDAH